MGNCYCPGNRFHDFCHDHDHIISTIIEAIVQAIKTGEKEPHIELDKTEDERDRLIDLRGTKATYTVSSIGVGLSIAHLCSGAAAIGDVYPYSSFAGVSKSLVIFPD
ncbi:MAG: hypothetical protein R3E31_24445 [Chloroflexota bacterium]